MSDIDRRTIIGVAGATMALAACKPGNGDGDGDGGGYPPGGGQGGINDQWGEDPHKSGPDVKPEGGFSPGYVCAIYVKFDANGQVMIRHGYIETGMKRGEESDEAFDARQIAAAEEMLTAAATDKDWKASRVGDPRKEVNFEGFNFGRQMRLFAVVDNDSVKFDDRQIDGRYANLVRFTKYQTAHDMGRFAPKLTNPNHAFFGATLVDLRVADNARKALRLDNWYIGPKAAEIKKDDPKTYQLFAMDFLLLWQTADVAEKVRSIPIIIDPDGGNMGSQP
ncbi:MAG: hypothetical protein ACRCY3_01140 [Sphingorhabdus sp.]